MRDEVRLGVLLEWRRGRNYVDDIGFSFSEGADRGVSTVVPLRVRAQWIRRQTKRVLALRGMVSMGLPILGYTHVPDADADGEFVSFIGQAHP